MISGHTFQLHSNEKRIFLKEMFNQFQSLKERIKKENEHDHRQMSIN
jgi:hypothetical protein